MEMPSDYHTGIGDSKFAPEEGNWYLDTDNHHHTTGFDNSAFPFNTKFRDKAKRVTGSQMKAVTNVVPDGTIFRDYAPVIDGHLRQTAEYMKRPPVVQTTPAASEASDASWVGAGKAKGVYIKRVGRHISSPVDSSVVTDVSYQGVPPRGSMEHKDNHLEQQTLMDLEAHIRNLKTKLSDIEQQNGGTMYFRPAPTSRPPEFNKKTAIDRPGSCPSRYKKPITYIHPYLHEERDLDEEKKQHPIGRTAGGEHTRAAPTRFSKRQRRLEGFKLNLDNPNIIMEGDPSTRGPSRPESDYGDQDLMATTGVIGTQPNPAIEVDPIEGSTFRMDEGHRPGAVGISPGVRRKIEASLGIEGDWAMDPTNMALNLPDTKQRRVFETYEAVLGQLRQEEEHLMNVGRHEELAHTRPPRGKWYERKDTGFTEEHERHLATLRSDWENINRYRTRLIQENMLTRERLHDLTAGDS